MSLFIPGGRLSKVSSTVSSIPADKVMHRWVMTDAVMTRENKTDKLGSNTVWHRDVIVNRQCSAEGPHTHTESYRHSPVIIGLEGAVLVQAHVLGLLVRKLRQVGVEVREVQTGHILVCRKTYTSHKSWGPSPGGSAEQLQYSSHLHKQYSLTLGSMQICFGCCLPIFLGSRYTSCLYRPSGALNNSIRARACRQPRLVWKEKTPARKTPTNIQTWVVAVMDSTNVGTVEQLRLRRRPWEMKKDAMGLQSNTIKRKSRTAGSSLEADTQVTQTTAGWYAPKNYFRLWWLIICQDFSSQATRLRHVRGRLTAPISS